jgi:hypothetical protein
MTRTTTAGIIAGLFVMFTTAAWAQDATVPAPRPMKVTSLRRASADWDVRTSIWLEADGVSVSGLRFVITSKPSKGELNCPGIGQPVSETRSLRCEYLPSTGLSGDDYFYYATETTAAGGNAVRSSPAKVDIDIQTRGLRWELIPVGTTGLTSDSNTPADIPSVFGKTAQDFLFVLNWVTDFPEQKLAANVRVARSQPLLRDNVQVKRSRSMNVVFKTGLVTMPMTVEAVDRGETTQAGPAPPAQPATPAETTAGMRRAFTAGAEANFNAVWKFDGSGTFAEFGGVGKGSFNVATETEDAEIQTDRLFELLRRERGTFRWELGARFVLRRDDPNEATTLIVKDDRVEHGRNAEDLLILEALVQRDNALPDLTTDDGDSRDRKVLRFIAMPKLPKLPAVVRPTLGVEASWPLRGGEPIIRFIYGANVGFK